MRRVGGNTARICDHVVGPQSAKIATNRFNGVSPCASDRCRFAAGAPRGGTRVERPRELGMDTPWGAWPRPPVYLLIRWVKNLYELKTRGVEKFFVFRFVAAAGNAHDFDSHFARGKRPRTATTGANTKQGS